jgi:hypothetical protein
MPLINAQAGSTSSGRNKRSWSPSGKPRAVGPLSENTVDHAVQYSTAQKIQALTLIAEKFSFPLIEQRTGIPRQTLYRIEKTAEQRGFCPDQDPLILEEYVLRRWSGR